MQGIEGMTFHLTATRSVLPSTVSTLFTVFARTAGADGSLHALAERPRSSALAPPATNLLFRGQEIGPWPIKGVKGSDGASPRPRRPRTRALRCNRRPAFLRERAVRLHERGSGSTVSPAHLRHRSAHNGKRPADRRQRSFVGEKRPVCRGKRSFVDR